MNEPNNFEDRLLDQLRQVVAESPTPLAAPRHRPRRTRMALAGVGTAAAAAAIAIVATSGDVTPNAYAVQPQADGAVSVSIHSLRDAAGLQSSLRGAGVPAVVDYVPSAQAGCAGPGPGAPSTAAAPVPGGPPRIISGEEGRVATGAATLRAKGYGVSGNQAYGTSLHQSKEGAPKEGSPKGALPPLSGPPPGAGDDGHVMMSSTMKVGSDGATFTIDPGDLKPGEKVFITTSSGALSSIGMAVGTTKPTVCESRPPTP